MNSPGGQPHVTGSLEPYKYEVFQQCFAATEAWNRAQGRLSTVPKGDFGQWMIAALQIVSDLQGFAIAVGILSDLFFPTSKGDSKRGELLRELYGVAESSPLIGADVQVRHALVHIDERLDRWLEERIGKPVGPLSIEPWEGEPPPMASASFARIVDNVNWRLLVLGEEMDFMPLLREVGRISTLYPLEFDGPTGKIRIGIAAPS